MQLKSKVTVTVSHSYMAPLFPLIASQQQLHPSLGLSQTCHTDFDILLSSLESV